MLNSVIYVDNCNENKRGDDDVLSYSEAVAREDILSFLTETITCFPSKESLWEDGVIGKNSFISEDIVEDWRWVICVEGKVIFANCITPCITEADFYFYLAMFSLYKEEG